MASLTPSPSCTISPTLFLCTSIPALPSTIPHTFCCDQAHSKPLPFRATRRDSLLGNWGPASSAFELELRAFPFPVLAFLWFAKSYTEEEVKMYKARLSKRSVFKWPIMILFKNEDNFQARTRSQAFAVLITVGGRASPSGQTFFLSFLLLLPLFSLSARLFPDISHS